MTKKPQKLSAKPKPPLATPIVASPVEPAPEQPPPIEALAPAPAELPPAEHIPSPLNAREQLFSIAALIAEENDFEHKPAELWAVVEEQFIPLHQRVINRFHRNADSMLYSKLENDRRFQEAVKVAKGEVF